MLSMDFHEFGDLAFSDNFLDINPSNKIKVPVRAVDMSEIDLLKKKNAELEQENIFLKQELLKRGKEIKRYEKQLRKMTLLQSELEQRQKLLAEKELLVSDMLELKIIKQQEQESLLLAQRLIEDDKAIISARLLDDPDNKHECLICLMTCTTEEIFWCDDCDHSEKICIKCLHEYCKNKVKINDLEILCPVEKCSIRYNFETVSFLLQDKELMDKYELFLYEHVLSSFKDIIQCSNIKCLRHVPVRDGELVGICLACNTATCKMCYDQEHSGITCEKYKELKLANKDKKNEDIMFDVWRSKNIVKQCPDCKFNVIKSSGCNMMVCTNKCKTKFCFVCGIKISNYDHFEKGKCQTY
jgi:hypothetical protein